MLVVHLGTTTQSEFLVVDDAGEVIDRKTVSGSLPALSAVTWAHALAEIQRHRAELVPAPAPIDALPALPALTEDEEVSHGA